MNNTEQAILFRDLPWDTAFFGFKVASLTCVEEPNEESLRPIVERCREEGYRLLYLHLPGENHPPLITHSGAEFRLMDIKYNFGCDLQKIDIESPIDKVYLYKGEAEPLLGLAFQAGEHSRYRLDPHFAPGEFERFYRTWVENSLNGSIADYLFTVGEPHAPRGFVTLKIREQEASVGLIAIDSSCRGEGLGRRLMLRSLEQAARVGCRRLTVATQKENTGACAFYRRLGMSPIEISSIYHCWLNE